MPIPVQKMLGAATRRLGAVKPPTARGTTAPLTPPAIPRPSAIARQPTLPAYQPKPELIQRRDPVTGPLTFPTPPRAPQFSSPATNAAAGAAGLGVAGAGVGGLVADDAARNGRVSSSAPAPLRPLIEGAEQGYAGVRTDAAKAMRGAAGLPVAAGGPPLIDPEGYSTPEDSAIRQDALIDPVVADAVQRQDFYARPAY